MSKFVFASRSIFCKWHKLKDAASILNCKADVDPDKYEYIITNIESHLECTSFDCGCKLFSNKYYSDFNFSSVIWNDFFSIPLDPGQKNLKVYFTTNISKNKRK